MSTRATIQFIEGEVEVHTYRDLIDDKDFVYLDVRNVDFESYLCDGKGSVMIRFPAAVAKELGLKTGGGV
jgi:hypothetical protein